MRKFILICGAFVLLIFNSRGQLPGKKDNGTLIDSINKKTPQKDLKEVIVTATKPYITQSADKITLNVAQSPLAAGGNAWDILLRAPGVIEQNGSLSYSGKTINVLINGRPTALSGEELKNMLSTMPANSIDKVEITSSPSAKYDAQGGSIINIRLLKNQQFGTNGIFTAGIGAGRFARGSTGLSLNYRNKNMNIYGSYDYAFNRQFYDNTSNRELNPLTAVTEHEYEVRTRNNHAFKLGLDYDINKNTSLGILLRVSSSFRDRTVSDESVIKRTAGKDSSSIVTTNGYARFLNNTLNVYYKKTLNAGRELTVNGDYLDYRKTWTDDFTTHYFDDTGKEYVLPFILRDHSPADNTIRSITIDYVHPSKWAKWEAGLKTAFTTTDNDVLWMQQLNTAWKTDSGKTNHFIFRENINAAYLNFSKVIKKYTIQAGLRAEQTNTKGESITLGQTNPKNYFNLFPNLAVQYAWNKKNQLGFNYRKSIQRFGFDFVNPFIVYHSQYAYYQGNPAIEPMILHSFELSYAWQSQFFVKLGYTHNEKVLGPVYHQDPATNAIVSSYGNLRGSDLYTSTITWVKNFCKGKWVATNTGGTFYSRYDAVPGSLDRRNEKLTGFISTNNAFTLSKKIKAELSGYYYSPFASGVYLQKSLYQVSAAVSASIMAGKATLALNVTDIFNTMRVRYDVLYGQTNIHYNYKTESRLMNLVFTYRFGNSKVKAGKTRKTGIEDEKSRMGAN